MLAATLRLDQVGPPKDLQVARGVGKRQMAAWAQVSSDTER
jgi:hypothetical protein